ncbi:hypothetical protein [Kitasatospora sp. NPDC054795]
MDHQGPALRRSPAARAGHPPAGGKQQATVLAALCAAPAAGWMLRHRPVAAAAP